MGCGIRPRIFHPSFFLPAHPHCHSSFEAFTRVRPFTSSGQEPVGQPNHVEWIQHHLPLYATNFIEDHDPAKQVAVMVGGAGDEHLIVLEPSGDDRKPPSEC